MSSLILIHVKIATFFMLLLQSGYCAGSRSNREQRESLDFVLPDPLDPIGQKCLQFDQWFCLMGYWINYKQSDREPQPDDREQFEMLAQPFFKQINWFSFKPQDASNGGCCSYQVNLYVEYGQKFGLSPVEYHKKIFYFAETGNEETRLVFLKTQWSTLLCMNVISQLGFGRGDLKVIGSKRMSRPFVIPPLGTNETKVHIFGGSEVRTDLNFAWFMHYVLCKGKPDLCPDDMDIEVVGTSQKMTIDRRTRRRILMSSLFGNYSDFRN